VELTLSAVAGITEGLRHDDRMLESLLTSDPKFREDMVQHEFLGARRVRRARRARRERSGHLNVEAGHKIGLERRA